MPQITAWIPIIMVIDMCLLYWYNSNNICSGIIKQLDYTFAQFFGIAWTNITVFSMEATCTTPSDFMRPWESPKKRITNNPDGRRNTKSSPKTISLHHNRTKSRSPKSRSLNTRAIELMEMWYHQHTDHPYPSDHVIDYIVKEGNVTSTQIRKWMANKRVWSYNTLSYSQTVHPKRLKRLQRDLVTKPLHSLPHDHFYQVMKMSKPTMQPVRYPVDYTYLLQSHYVPVTCVSKTNDVFNTITTSYAPCWGIAIFCITLLHY